MLAQNLSLEQKALDLPILSNELSRSLSQASLRGDYEKILTSPVAQLLLRGDEALLTNHDEDWNTLISRKVHTLLVHLDHLDQQFASQIQIHLVLVGTAALNAFLQANVTGPPLAWTVSEVLFSADYNNDSEKLTHMKRQLRLSLTIDGEAIYHLTPHIELFCLAKCILNQECSENEDLEWLWARLRTNSWHQRMLNDPVDSLQKIIFRDLELVEKFIFDESPEIKAQFLLERASILTYYGFDVEAREDLKAAKKIRRFDFALTGRLGKRTKFQQDELSQLVVLAKSADDLPSVDAKVDVDGPIDMNQNQNMWNATLASKPLNLDLNDDTLLEAISFSKDIPVSTDIQDAATLPQSLIDLDPANQPILQPLDSIILLAFASSILHTSPQDDLMREEISPYAARVLAGGSTNWQIYTQALLVRSRIEAYRSRTVERGVLQLQALVDQVIVETTQIASTEISSESTTTASTSFLPKLKASESAPVSERLLYIHQLASPTRWKLEAELADRWITLGGLRTALEIYERLQMWAEVALCWAASDREDKAREIIRSQLYESLPNDHDVNASPTASELGSLPADAPRLFCILGDLEKNPAAYQRAWEVSGGRYARSQRSLGKYYLAEKDLSSAEEAYVKSIKISPQNHDTWFTLGSIRLQLSSWIGAADAFGRAIQIDGTDAESWSNLAAALLKSDPGATIDESLSINLEDDEEGADGYERRQKSSQSPQKNIQRAFVALKRAASIKRDSYRIWQNLLNVSVKISPPPYTDIIIAQSRLIELLSNVEGEKCVDAEVVEGLVAHLIASTPSQSIYHSNGSQNTTETPPKKTQNSEYSNDFEIRKPGFPRMLIDLVQNKITPLITTSRRLWLLTAKVSLYLQHPSATLAAYEKSWRVTLNRPGWERGSQEATSAWNEVVDSTVELVDAYESLGERKREAGMGEGELVCKEWRFKSRSAIRGVLGRAKEGWGGSEGYKTLEERLIEL